MNQQPIFIITGEQGEGKTTRLTEVVGRLTDLGIPVRGFAAPGRWKGELRSGFSIVNLNTLESAMLCSDKSETGLMQIGRFHFNPKTITIGEKLLQKKKTGDILVIDEVGLFEIKGKVWGDVLSKLLETSDSPMLITVRRQFLDAVVEHFKMKNTTVFDVKKSSIDIAEKISCSLR